MSRELLQQEIDRKGARQVARELGVSLSTVTLILKGKYGASPQRIFDRAQALYGREGRVECPILGEITPDACADKWHLAKTVGTRVGNPETLRLYHACLRCPIRRGRS